MSRPASDRGDAVFHRFVISAPLLLIVAGCGMHWHSLGDPTESDPLPSPLRITTVSGRQIIVYQPTIAEGKIVGLRSKPYDSVTLRRVSVRLDSVATVEYGQPKAGDRIATGSATALGVGILVAFAIVILSALGGPWGAID
jgi:hypothetical protein